MPVNGPVAGLLPRLLDVPQGSRYIGVGPWEFRRLVWSGIVPRVRIPLPNGGELRKLLVDVRDLDRLVESWKDERGPAA
jgi:hypothetical protein